MLANTKNLIIFLLIIYAIDPFSYGFLAGYLIFIVLLFNIKKAKKYFDLKARYLLFFSITYSIFYLFDLRLGLQFVFIYAIIPTTFYLIGRLLYRRDVPEIKNSIILLMIGFAFSSTSMASVLRAIYEHGFITIKRDVPVIWTGNIIPATNMAANFVMNICLPGIFLIGFRKIKPNIYKFLAISLFLLSITCVLRLGSRTHLALILFSVLVAIIYRFRKQNILQNIVLFFLIFFTLNVGFAYISLDKESDLLSAYADRMDSKKYGASSAGGRTERWEKSIEYMFSDPLGWELNEFGFAHNLWFDALRVGGIICFVILLIFTFIIIRDIFRLFQHRSSINLLDGQLIIYFICFLLVFFVEPILEGYFILFSLFCFISGFSTTHLNKPIQLNSKTGL